MISLILESDLYMILNLTPLHIAVSTGNVETVQFLLSLKEVDVNKKYIFIFRNYI